MPVDVRLRCGIILFTQYVLLRIVCVRGRRPSGVTRQCACAVMFAGRESIRSHHTRAVMFGGSSVAASLVTVASGVGGDCNAMYSESAACNCRTLPGLHSICYGLPNDVARACSQLDVNYAHNHWQRDAEI